MKHRTSQKSVYQFSAHLAVALLMLIIFVSVAYFFFVPANGLSPDQERLLANLQAQKKLWDDKRPLSFRYVVDRNCVCTDKITTPYIATETPGHKSATYRIVGQPESGDLATSPPDALWIDDLFGIIEDEIIENGTVNASYDWRFGFPHTISSGSLGSADGSFTYYVRDFEAM